MAITMEQIKSLRGRTGAGVVDVKKALDEANGDDAKALEILKKRGHDKAIKKADRDASEGIIGQYVHSNGKIGVLVKLLCETDFVARNEEFVSLSRDIAMHIAAMDPECLRSEDVSNEKVLKEREIWTEQLKNEGKKEEIIQNILLGKEKKFRNERALLSQFFIKNPEMTVEQIITEKISRMGENIQVGDFIRYEL
ncbi:MAG: elongation factor Ts [Candidatus Moraniibacteriota bacterium]|nr:MAG: elongation factor Ts [Candidatus Moranbacteria bacterium]